MGLKCPHVAVTHDDNFCYFTIFSPVAPVAHRPNLTKMVM